MLGASVAVALMVGMFAALVPAVVLFARHGAAARKMGVPFVPFLAFGAVVALFFGEWTLDAYLGAVLALHASRRGRQLPITPSRDRMRYRTRIERRRAGRARRPGRPACRQLGTPFGSDETAELVLDLLGHTGLVAPGGARARARPYGRRHARSTQALIDEGVAAADGVARMLAVRHHLPLVDLPSVGVSLDAAQLIPVQTLERAVAVPYALEGDVLKVAVADPGNLHAIDELRLATKLALELGVASRDDIDRRAAAAGSHRRCDRLGRRRDGRRRATTATTSRSTTASPTARSSGS